KRLVSTEVPEVLLPEQGARAVELRYREVEVGADILGYASGDHIALVVHRHGERLVKTAGGATEVPLPEQGAVAVELRHREQGGGAVRIVDDAGGDHIPLVVHRRGERRVKADGDAVEVLLPEQGADAVQLCDREVE